MQHILNEYQRAERLPSKKDEQIALVLYGFHRAFSASS